MKPKKRKRTAPPRYLMTWTHTPADRLPEDVMWHEKLMARPPVKHRIAHCTIPFRCEDLLKAHVFNCNFNLRQEAHFATHKWPLREKALAALKKYYAPKPPVDRAKKRARKLALLQAREKNWVRKIKTGQTKLRKIRAALRRLT